MTPDILLLIAERAGVFVFAISGAIVAVRKDMDLFGVIVLAFLPAIGGGTLRDLILDVPVFWLNDPASLGLAVVAALFTFGAHRWLENFRPLRWADAFGLALFAVQGAAKTYALGHNAAVVIIMGTITATAGGLMRDVIANDEPLLLREDIYATAAILGCVAYVGFAMIGLPPGVPLIAGLIVGFAIRALAIRYRLSLPTARRG